MENMESLKNKIKNCCIEKEDPFCTSHCPFDLDVREFVSRVQRGGFNLAYRLYSNTVGFPFIVSELCKAPCKDCCPRSQTDSSIAIDLLEKASVDYASNTNPNNYNMPAKEGRVAIIGAGLSGLGCALRLANKKYKVTVYEKSNRIGGQLWGLLDSNIFLEDIDRQFMYEQYDLHLNTEITDIQKLSEEFDAVYVATGKGGNSFGLLEGTEIDGIPFASRIKGIFIGGSVLGADCIEALAQGLKASNAIETYLKTDNMKSVLAPPPTKIQIDPSALTEAEYVAPSSNGRYTKEEASEEAKRCIKCRCDSCARHCGLMQYFEKMPKRIEEEVHITINPGTLDGNGTVATRFISTCNQCGLCKEVCPEKIDVGMFLRHSHNAMRDKDAMPWAYHEFWLRDMEFANSDRASFDYLPKGHTKSKYMFFPGCQLGASNPDYVLESYHFLLKKMPDTSLCLMCCGAPAAWSGDYELHKNICKKITDKWHKLGEPTVILACHSCRQFFAENMPKIKCVSLYDIMLEYGITASENGEGMSVSVFDPCTSRNYPESQEAVRSLLEKAEYVLNPLPYEKKTAQCCSWGGQISIANPKYTNWLIGERVNDGKLPYVTYCSNCKDIFASVGKPVKHILDIVFGLEGWKHDSPTASGRWRNREYLQRMLSKEFYPESKKTNEVKPKFFMTADVEKKLDSRKILEEDILTVINFCESRGRSVIDPATGHKFGYQIIGHMTFWAEYSVTDSGYCLFNAYTHRMKIELEEVWNGRKQNHDML